MIVGEMIVDEMIVDEMTCRWNDTVGEMVVGEI